MRRDDERPAPKVIAYERARTRMARLVQTSEWLIEKDGLAGECE
jgi:hypothetical protein